MLMPGQAEARPRLGIRDRAAPTQPTRPAEGPLQIVISIGSQRLWVYDSKGLLETSTISTGVGGYPTPTGVFAIIDKEVTHYSNIYGGASMPFMQRLTMSGVAMHSGMVTGRPASHGCVRLPHPFAVKLYRLTRLGARVVKPPADIPNVGRFAVLSDPQGATFAVFTPEGGPPPGGSPAQGTFSWHELATTDVAAALRFYGQLFGWTKGPGHDMGGMGVYQVFQHGGTQAGGVCNVQGPASAPSWLSYVHIADCGRAVAAGKAAGGRLLHGPMEVPGGSWIAMMMDPQGGAFAVQEAPRVVQSKPAGATPKRR